MKDYNSKQIKSSNVGVTAIDDGGPNTSASVKPKLKKNNLKDDKISKKKIKNVSNIKQQTAFTVLKIPTAQKVSVKSKPIKKRDNNVNKSSKKLQIIKANYNKTSEKNKTNNNNKLKNKSETTSKKSQVKNSSSSTSKVLKFESKMCSLAEQKTSTNPNIKVTTKYKKRKPSSSTTVIQAKKNKLDSKTNKENIKTNIDCKTRPHVDTESCDYYDDDKETTEFDSNADDSWSTYNEDEDDDNFYSEGQSANNKSNKKGTSRGYSSKSINKSKTCSGSKCTNSNSSMNQFDNIETKNEFFEHYNDDENDIKMNFLNSKFYNSVDSRYVLLLLKSKIYIQGAIKLKLIAGQIEIFGYKPKINETLEVFSPRGYSHLSITPIKLSSSLSSSPLDNNNINNDDNNINFEFINTFKNDFMSNDWIELFNYKTDALILLERCNKQEIEMINKYMKENMFIDRSIFSKRLLSTSENILQCIFEEEEEEKDDEKIGDTEKIITTSENCQNDNKIKIDKIWNEIEISSMSKILIIGGKNVGKSTLLRYLINCNIKKFSKLAILDFDIGQPEIFVPQTISAIILDKPLLGPGYLHSLKPNKSLLFGDKNILSSPTFYIKNIKNLIDYCNEQEEFHNIPWFINTMGYNKGFGSELISIIIKLLKPTNIIQLHDEYKDINNYDYIMTTDNINQVPKYLFDDEIFNNDDLINQSYTNNHQLHLFKSVANLNRNKRKVIQPIPMRINRKNKITANDKRYEMIIAHCGHILNKGYDEWLTDVHSYT